MYTAIPHRSLNYMYIIINILVERVLRHAFFSILDLSTSTDFGAYSWAM